MNLLGKNIAISSVANHLTRSAEIMAKLRHFAKKNTLKLIYFALPYRYLTYGNIGKYLSNQIANNIEN